MWSTNNLPKPKSTDITLNAQILMQYVHANTGPGRKTSSNKWIVQPKSTARSDY